MRCASLLLASILLAGCDGRPLELSVDVRTDLVAGEDFSAIRIEVRPGQGTPIDPVTRDVSAGEAWHEGLRAAEIIGVPPGTSRVRAVLLDAAGEEVAGRAIDITMMTDYALTIVITGDCIGRSCPGVSEPGSFTECLYGECIDPRCGGSSPEGCGSLACESASDCVGVLDCAAACIGGACACTGPEIGVDAGPDAGPPPVDAGPPPVDAGPCPGECTAGATSEETMACGACGEGIARRTRTCGSDCRWGAFGAFGACETSATCSPGQTQSDSQGCGNCGTQRRTRSCNATTCTWGAWGTWGTCGGTGECAPGATRAGGCDMCSHQVCSGSCNWGGCTLRSGNQCNYQGGTNWRCCGSNAWQFCLSSCRWSSDCAGGCGCGC